MSSRSSRWRSNTATPPLSSAKPAPAACWSPSSITNASTTVVWWPAANTAQARSASSASGACRQGSAYFGCHYVDLVHFITGLLPVAVSVYGVRDRFPNGNEGFLWTDARVIWSNGACLNVQNGLGFPDDAPGTNTQGLVLYCGGDDKGGLLEHSDQYRGLKHSYESKPDAPGATIYAEPSPDYFQYVDLGGEGLTPVGYGYRSVEHIVSSIIRLESAPEGRRGELLDEFDRAGIIATPRNSSYNERAIEAGRQSIVNGGVQVEIP